MFSRSLIPTVFQNYLILNNNFNSYNTAAKNDAHVLRFNTMFGSRSIDNKCAIIWNWLPDNFKKCMTVINLIQV